MEEENKTQATVESNPNEGNQVEASDLEENESKGNEAPTGEEKPNDQKSVEEGKPQANPKQSREEDAKFAEERRKRKARDEARQKAREEEIRRQAVFEVKSGQVTADELSELGLDKVEDDDQLFLVESLRKAKADGNENPLAKAYQDLYRKKSVERAEAKAKSDAEKAVEEKRMKMVAQDQANFKAKFGKTTAEVVKNEEEFMNLFGNMLDADKANFTELYTAYTTLKKSNSDTAKKQGSFPTNPSGSQGSSSEEESDEDFKKRWIAEHGHW